MGHSWGGAAAPDPRASRGAAARVDHGRLAEAVLGVGDVGGDAGVVHSLEGHHSRVLDGPWTSSRRKGVRVPGHQDRRQHWRLDPLVVVGVDADILKQSLILTLEHFSV